MIEKRKNNGKVPNLRFLGFEGKWELKELGSIGEFYSGGTPRTTNRSYYNGTIPFIRSGEINSEETELFISEEGLKNSSAKIVEKGQLLIALYGATSGEIAISKINGAINQAVLCVNTDESKEFIQGVWKKHIDRILKNYLQGGQGNLSAALVKGLKFNFPSKLEQDKIASLLTLVDIRINTQNEIINGYESLIKGLSQSLFTQKIRFKNKDKIAFKDWEKKKIGDICLKKSSNISANKIENNFGEYIVYGASGILKYIDFYKERDDYISIVKDGAGVGRLFYCEGKSSVLSTMDIIKPKNGVNPYFLFYLLNTINFTKYITGSTIPHIYFKDYKKEKRFVPSLEEQNKIASLLLSIDQKVQVEKTTLKLLQNQKEHLLQQMFI